MKVTNTNVSKVTPPAKGYTLHWDAELPGFGVRVTAAGARSYVCQAKVAGKARRVTLGRHGIITADQARRKAKAALGRMVEGADPTSEKRRTRALGVTLREVVEDYLENRRTRAGLPLKDRTKADIRRHLETSFSAWRDRPAAGITRDMVARWYAKGCKTSIAQTNQAARVLRGLLNYAAGRHRTPDGAQVLNDNPVNVLSDTNAWRDVAARKNHIPLDRVGAWWSAVQSLRAEPALIPSATAAADLVALLALTGLRMGEASALQWEQVDGDSITLTDTKNRSDVTLPLSDAAANIIHGRTRQGRWVFPARSGPGHLTRVNATMGKLAAVTGVKVSPHDLRRTFRAVAAQVGIELWRVKALMNHKQTADVTLLNYTDLSDVRYLKPEADRIAAYFENQCHISEGENVVSMEARHG